MASTTPADTANPPATVSGDADVTCAPSAFGDDASSLQCAPRTEHSVISGRDAAHATTTTSTTRTADASATSTTVSGDAGVTCAPSAFDDDDSSLQCAPRTEQSGPTDDAPRRAHATPGSSLVTPAPPPQLTFKESASDTELLCASTASSPATLAHPSHSAAAAAAAAAAAVTVTLASPSSSSSSSSSLCLSSSPVVSSSPSSPSASSSSSSSPSTSLTPSRNNSLERARVAETITRPASAPLKPRAEEEKHRRQHEQQMRAFARKQEQRMQEEREREKRRNRREDARRAQSRKLCTKTFVHSFSAKVLAERPAVRQLFWDGLLPSVRSQLWARALANELRITTDLYELLLSQVAERGASAQIHLDLPRTFPLLQFFQPGGPEYDSLRHVLEAFALFRPHLGYVQGMSFLAATLLLFLTPAEAFCVLANLLQKRLFRHFYAMQTPQIEALAELCLQVLRDTTPPLHAHLVATGVPFSMILIDMVLPFFTKSLSLDLAAQMFDIYFAEEARGLGEAAVVRIVVALVSSFSAQLVGSPFDTTMTLLTHLPHEQLDGEEFVRRIATVRIDSSRVSARLTEAGWSAA